MVAARAPSLGRECVPHHAAPFEKWLGGAATVTTPAARVRGAPIADRATDPAERVIVIWCDDIDSDRVRGLVVFQQQHCDLRAGHATNSGLGAVVGETPSLPI